MSIEELKSTEQKEEIPEWEKLIDKWVEDKIQKQMEKFGISDREEAEKTLKEKFKKVFPCVFKDFAVHGIVLENGQIGQFTDMDGKVCLGLLDLTGFKIREKGEGVNVSFIEHSEQLEEVVHMDVGNKNISESSGVAFLEKTEEGLNRIELSDEDALKKRTKEGKMFFSKLGMVIDHHPEGAPSASGMIYKILNKTGFFENNKKIDEAGGLKKIKKMIKFIDIIDSNSFQEIGKPENWDNSDRTILGLHRFMNFANLLNFFKEDGNYNRPLIDEVLRRYGLIYSINRNGEKKTINRQKQQREIINVSNKRIEELQKNDFIIESKIGKIIIDIDRKVPGGASAAQSVGASYLNWNSKDKTFFLFSQEELDKDFSEMGIVTRKHLCLLPKSQKSSELKLKTFIDKIGGVVIPGSGLEHYLKTRD